MKQPRVPEYREAEGVSRYVKSLILFLKDFTSEAWTANNQRKKEIENVISNMPEIEYPVTSVNGKKGDVVVLSSDPREGDAENPELGGIEIDGEEGDGEGVVDPLVSWPIGSIYTSAEEESPASLFGGTWEMLQDRFLIGAGGSYGAGATGGAATHKLTINEMPSHDHNVVKKNTYDRLVMMAAMQNGYGSAGGAGDNGTWYWNYGVPAQGGSAAHNNMPPYLAVYMWKRVA